MYTEKLYKKLLEEFNLKDLDASDREDILLEISKTIQKQFLLDVYDLIREKNFETLQASANMGEEFYLNTLKHFVPDHEKILASAMEKVVKKFKEEKTAVLQ